MDSGAAVDGPFWCYRCSREVTLLPASGASPRCASCLGGFVEAVSQAGLGLRGGGDRSVAELQQLMQALTEHERAVEDEDEWMTDDGEQEPDHASGEEDDGSSESSDSVPDLVPPRMEQDSDEDEVTESESDEGDPEDSVPELLSGSTESSSSEDEARDGDADGSDMVNRTEHAVDVPPLLYLGSENDEEEEEALPPNEASRSAPSAPAGAGGGRRRWRPAGTWQRRFSPTGGPSDTGGLPEQGGNIGPTRRMRRRQRGARDHDGAVLAHTDTALDVFSSFQDRGRQFDARSLVGDRGRQLGLLLQMFDGGLQQRGGGVVPPGQLGGTVYGDPGDYVDARGFDRLLQQLAESDNQRRGAPPASKAAVERLEHVTLEESERVEDPCSICKEELQVKSTVIKLPCSHLYHPDCLLPWLKERNSCPICRYELPTDDTDYEQLKRNRDRQTATASGSSASPLVPPQQEAAGESPLRQRDDTAVRNIMQLTARAQALRAELARTRALVSDSDGDSTRRLSRGQAGEAGTEAGGSENVPLLGGGEEERVPLLGVPAAASRVASLEAQLESGNESPSVLGLPDSRLEGETQLEIGGAVSEGLAGQHEEDLVIVRREEAPTGGGLRRSQSWRGIGGRLLSFALHGVILLGVVQLGRLMQQARRPSMQISGVDVRQGEDGRLRLIGQRRAGQNASWQRVA